MKLRLLKNSAAHAVTPAKGGVQDLRQRWIPASAGMTLRGQILPLALVLIMGMALVWVMVINVGKLIKDRIQVQIAADAAVQSACAVRARGLNAIGRMNSWLGTPG